MSLRLFSEKFSQRKKAILNVGGTQTGDPDEIQGESAVTTDVHLACFLMPTWYDSYLIHHFYVIMMIVYLQTVSHTWYFPH